MRLLLACARTLSFLRSGSLLLLFAMRGPTAYVFAESETGTPPPENIDEAAEHAETSAAVVWLFTDSNLFVLQLTHVTRAGDNVLSGTTMSSGVTTPLVVVVNVTEVTYESLDEGVGFFQDKDGAYGLMTHLDETRTTLLAVGGHQFDRSFVAIESSGLSAETIIGLATTLLRTPLDTCMGLASAVCGGQDQVCWLDIDDCIFTCLGDPGCPSDSKIVVW